MYICVCTHYIPKYLTVHWSLITVCFSITLLSISITFSAEDVNTALLHGFQVNIVETWPAMNGLSTGSYHSLFKHYDEVMGAITGGNILANWRITSCSRSIMYHGMSHQLTNFLLCGQEGCSMSVLHWYLKGWGEVEGGSCKGLMALKWKDITDIS